MIIRKIKKVNPLKIFFAFNLIIFKNFSAFEIHEIHNLMNILFIFPYFLLSKILIYFLKFYKIKITKLNSERMLKMNQKNLKIIKRIMSGFLALFFVMSVGYFSKKIFSLPPTVGNEKVFTFTDGLMRSWGNVSLTEGTAVDDNTGSNQKIFFGCNPETRKPYTWWIAGRTHSNGELSSDPAHSSHMILYSTKDVQASQFTCSTKALNFSDASAEQKHEFSYLKSGAFPMNHYGISTARKALKDCVFHILSPDEKKLIRESSVQTFDPTNHTHYITTDKFYLPSGNQALNVVSFGTDDISTKTTLTPQEIQKLIPKKYLPTGHDDANIFWTRSAALNNSNQQYIFSSGKETAVKTFPAIYGLSCSALCKVNLETVYFAATASAFHTRNKFENQGKVTPLDLSKDDYGMHLKTIPAGTSMSDAVVKVQPNTSIFSFENAPKDSYLTACLVDSANANLTYTVSVPVNPDGKTSSGKIDISKLDTSAVGKGKKLNVIAWLEMENKDNIVASYPQTTCVTTSDDIIISKIENKSYTGEKIEPAPVLKCSDKTLTMGKDYSITYINNTNVGTASVIIKGLGAYEGKTAFATFEIIKNVPKLELANKKVIYSGEAVKIDPPKISDIPNADKFDFSEITYVYYKDAECSKRICSITEKDKKNSKLPCNLGTYYVKAMIAETDTHEKAESNIAKIDIVAE